MKLIQILCFLSFFLMQETYSQELPYNIRVALRHDDSVSLSELVNNENIDSCYEVYSLLSQAIRRDSKKCFYWLINHGANVNNVCGDYVPPLMHAAKYGHLEMVKALVAKGADVNYVHNGGKFEPLKGKTPITYAEMHQKDDVVDYLRSLRR